MFRALVVVVHCLVSSRYVVVSCVINCRRCLCFLTGLDFAEKLGSCTQSHDNKIMMAGMTDDDGRLGGSSIDDEW